MSSVLNILGSQLDASTLEQLGNQVGASREQTAAAVSAALPALLGALQRNSATPHGEAALSSALDRDHDGSILDNLGSLLGGGPSAANVRSLDHIFRDRRGNVEDAVAQRSGLDSGQVMKLLAMLAPLVLGALSRARQQSGGPAAQTGGGGGGGLGDLLGAALGGLRQQGAGGGGGLGGILGGLLDRNHDGSFLDDLLGGGGGDSAGSGTSSGGGLLGGLLDGLGGGRRG